MEMVLMCQWKYKTCKRCGETKIRGLFHKSNTKDGFDSKCNLCRRELAKERKKPAGLSEPKTGNNRFVKIIISGKKTNVNG